MIDQKLAESVERPKIGERVTVHNFWVRHAQKTSGAIANKEATAVSTSSISEKGVIQSHDFGLKVEGQSDGAKAYISDSKRTSETVENILKGYQEANKDAPIRESFRVKNELSMSFPPDFLKLYDEKFVVERKKIMKEKGISVEFSTLSPNQQEEIAEVAEEPVIMEWLSGDDNELARLYPPEKVASKFAVLFNRRHERLATKLYSDSKLDLFHITHKTITEPFLVSGVLIRKSDNHRITRVEELGGSLEVLGNWESTVSTDEAGESAVAVTIRGIEYTIDNNRLRELLNYGKEETHS
ncbi:MAG TPA: hypothetical protein VJH63_03075 [Candidatus Paceibacterota bacterium]